MYNKNKKTFFLSIKFNSILIFTALIIFFYSVYNIKQTKIITTYNTTDSNLLSKIIEKENKNNTYIKWMEFNVPVEVLRQALDIDIKSYKKDIHYNWIELISLAAAKNWGKFEGEQKSKDIDIFVERLKKGETVNDIAKNLKLYSFYLQVYSAVLSDYVGEFEVEEKDKDGNKIFVRRYGLKVFSPIAKNYSYTDYNDFGVSRTYGYKRKHQGHDIFAGVGTPIISIEDGYVEVMGWNVYGGWRIGIRSNDKKRYYYYAHLRKDHPFNKALKVGDLVKAGDVIGYMGMTGYSTKENTNNIEVAHLHLGLQIIFDESQKDGINQIWVDMYNIVRFLSKNAMPVYKNTDNGDYVRKININSIIID